MSHKDTTNPTVGPRNNGQHPQNIARNITSQNKNAARSRKTEVLVSGALRPVSANPDDST